MAVITMNASSHGRSYNELPAYTFLSDSICMRWGLCTLCVPCVKEVAYNRQIGALMTEMEQSILKPDRETATAVKLFLKIHPYYYGRNARHMVGLQPLFIHSPSVPGEISFIYEYWNLKQTRKTQASIFHLLHLCIHSCECILSFCGRC